jgi:2-methylisocitrate lyase-like PEP mutase family enzyme
MTYLGVPDWGVITTTDMVEIAGRIAREVSIPAIVDADQAGETSLNVYRTVQQYERAGMLVGRRGDIDETFEPFAE